MKNIVALIGAFLLLAFVISWWKVIVGVMIGGGIVWGAVVLAGRFAEKRRDRINGERARNSALAARADRQHEAYLRGEDRGLYGEFRPARLD